MSNELSTTAARFKAAENDKAAAVSETLAQKYGLAGGKAKLLELEQEVSELKRKVEVGGHSVDFAGLGRLMEEIQKAQLEGVYGTFAQLIEVDKTLHFAVEALAKAKLYSIVVRDERVAEELIELNKRIKGPRIQIYPLTWISEHDDSRDYPTDNQIIILERHVEPKYEYSEIGLKKLIREILGGCVLVNSYEEAQELQKSMTATVSPLIPKSSMQEVSWPK